MMPPSHTPTSEFNFTDILLEALIRADSKTTKDTVKLSVFFALLGSECVNAACKMLVKSTPVVKDRLAKLHFRLGLVEL